MRRIPYKTDQEWIEALKAGELDAWGETPGDLAGMSGHGLLGMVYGWALRDLRDSALAQDIALETGGRVLRYLGGFRGEAPLEQWVRRVYRTVLVINIPTFEYKLRYKLERWLKTVNTRSLEARSYAGRAIDQLRSDEQQVINLVRQSRSTEQIAWQLGLKPPMVRMLKNQGFSGLLKNREFRDMLVRVGNLPGKQRDTLAANIVAAYWESQEISFEALGYDGADDGEDMSGAEIVADPQGGLDESLSDWVARFWDCLDRLTEKQRDVIRLTWHYRLHHAGPENVDDLIAAELGITAQLVRLRRFQAKAPLKRCLEE